MGHSIRAKASNGRLPEAARSAWTFAAAASAKAPSAAARETCNAVAAGELRKRKCSFAMWTANAAALTNHAARRHRIPVTSVASAAKTMPMRPYKRPTSSTALTPARGFGLDALASLMVQTEPAADLMNAKIETHLAVAPYPL